MPEQQKKSTPEKKRRRWPRRLAIFLLFLSAAALIIDGPGSRIFLKKKINDELTLNQLSGTFKLEGNLHRGFTISNLKFEGTGDIKSLKAERLLLSYSLLDIFLKKINRLEVIGLHLDLTITDAPTHEKEPLKIQALSETIRPYLLSPDVDIDDLKIRLTYQDHHAQVSLDQLTHKSGSEQYLVHGFKTIDHLGRTTSNKVTHLEWQKNLLTLGTLNLLPKVTLNSLTIHSDARLSAKANLCGAVLDYTRDTKGQHTLHQAQGALSLSDIAALWNPSLPAEGFLTKINLTLREKENTLPEFDLQAELANPAWEGKPFPTVDIELHNDNRSPHGKLTFLKGDQPASLTFSSPKPIDPAHYTAQHINFDFKLPVGHHLLTTFDKNIQGLIQAQGQITPNPENPILKSDWSINLKTLDENPISFQLTGNTHLQDQIAKTTAQSFDDELQFSFDYSLQKNTYQFSAQSLLAQSQNLNPLLHYFKPELKSLNFSDRFHFKAKGQGSLEKQTHTGTSHIQEINFTHSTQPTVRLSSHTDWDWPQQLQIKKFTANNGESKINADLIWKDNLLEILNSTLTHQEQILATAKGTAPAPLVKNLKTNHPLDLKISTQPISLKILRQFIAIPESLQADFQTNLNLTGTYEKPSLLGAISATSLQDINYPDLPPTDIELNFKTETQRLHLTGLAKEPAGPILNLSGSIPFLPNELLSENPPEDLPITLDLSSPRLDFSRFQSFLPKFIRQLDGHTLLDIKVRGTLKKPTYQGKANLKITKALLSESPISDIRNSELNLQFNEREITLTPSPLNIAGGRLTLSGEINLAGQEPIFDLSLTGKNALLWRNDLFSIRSNPNLKFSGPYSAAALTGTIKIVESIIYKDLDILPLSLANTAGTPQPDLPKFETDKFSTGLEPPFSDWLVDIAITTQDPILVRGNLAEGAITADTHLRGTLGKPQTSGTIKIAKLTASLPLSSLEIKNSLITLNPKNMFNPQLNIRGTSNINAHEVQIFVSGSLDQPRTNFSSSPPLPENEILTLLATGTTTSALSDQQLASQKALQYLIEGIRRKYAKPNGNGAFQRLLKNSDQIQLNLGEDDPFSGRRFTSASLELSRRWNITAAIDDQGQSRGLFVYSLRFK